MKQHSWLGGFDWDKLISQSLPAPYKPDISFDRTDVKGENMRKAVYDHINSKSIAPTDQHHFQRYQSMFEMTATTTFNHVHFIERHDTNRLSNITNLYPATSTIEDIIHVENMNHHIIKRNQRCQ